MLVFNNNKQIFWLLYKYNNNNEEFIYATFFKIKIDNGRVGR
jgi:hypothetical protein